MTDPKPAEQLKAIQAEMSRKANVLLEQILNTDQNGRPKVAAPTQSTPTAAERPAEDRIAEIDALIAADPTQPNTELHALRDRLMSDVSPGSGDGGTREPLPAPTLGEQMAEATARGDHATAMSLKSQQLAAIVDKQNGM